MTSHFDMNEEDKLYDEFGNYIGPQLSDDSNSSNDSDSDASSDWNEFDAHDASPRREFKQNEDPLLTEQQDKDEDDDMQNSNSNHQNIENPDSINQFNKFTNETMQLIAANDEQKDDNSNAIILHEDKQYYKSAEDTYPGAETMIQEEDTQPLETPIIAPVKQKCFEIIEKALPITTFDYKYLAGLMDKTQLIRNIMFIGHLHHGKTSFIDILVKQTHVRDWKLGKQIRYCDTRLDEQNRGISIKSTPISLVLNGLHNKHYLINIIDTPGHCNFSDEVTAALRLADGAVIVVDAIEGVLLNTERCIRHAAEQGLSMILVLNKIDRLIIELRLPPRDAYLKLLFTINEVNNVLKTINYPMFDPRKGNVCFSSALFGWSFTLDSFAKIYSQSPHSSDFNYSLFARKLWGDSYLHSDRKFYGYPQKDKKSKKKEDNSGTKRTFVRFILEPLYKIYSHTLGNDPGKLFPLFKELGIRLRKKELQLDPRPLLNVILGRFFGSSDGFVSMVIQHIPPPSIGNKIKVSRCYTGDLNTDLGTAVLQCDPKFGTAVVNVTKMYARPDASAFDGFGRVFAGTVKVGDKMKVLRENYTLDDNEDMSVMTIKKIWIYQGRYRVEINRVTAGNWALFDGIDTAVTKTATLVHDNQYSSQACIFRPLKFNTISVCKVAIEPIKPSELPKMTHGLRCINKSYPLCITKVEESGEHIILGTGEVYLDCVLHDLRLMYSEIEIKVSDPVVCFCETVDETSNMQCFAHTPNKKNKLTMICEPLDEQIANDIENEKISIEWTPKQLGEFFHKNYGWDLLSGRNVWAFGANKNGANILIDDTLPSDISKEKLNAIRNSVVQGFEWATREGPLCDEPIRNCRFKLMNATIADNEFERGGGQIIPTTRRVLYSSFMLANPRLMEPILFVEAICPADCIQAMEDVVHHRRGRLLKEVPKPGTPFVVINAEIPAIDSFGFETDLRSHTQGQAFCMQVFNRWDIVPGDPMDETITLMPLEPHPAQKLAREFMIKTRKRKGLAENVTYHKFFDDQMFKAFVQLSDGLD